MACETDLLVIGRKLSICIYKIKLISIYFESKSVCYFPAMFESRLHCFEFHVEAELTTKTLFVNHQPAVSHVLSQLSLCLRGTGLSKVNRKINKLWSLPCAVGVEGGGWAYECVRIQCDQFCDGEMCSHGVECRES